jgi:hypothetical protein
MVWLKRILVFLTSLVFLAALLAASLVTSLVISLSHPAKIEQWLSRSGLYSQILSSTIDQATTLIAANTEQYGISVSHSTIEAIADKVLTPAEIQNYTSTFLNANYAWLKGITPIPSFSINLTPVKQAFAQQMGQYIASRLSNIPVCSTNQPITELQSNDFQNLSCLPANISPSGAGDYIAQQIVDSKQFIGNDVITAQNISPNLNSTASKPYYKQISQAPTYYQLAEKLPYILSGIILICGLVIVFFSSTKRRGLRRIALSCIAIGVLVLIVMSLSSIAFAAVKNTVIGQVNSQIIEQSVLSVINQVEIQVNHANERIGEGYIAFGVITIIILLATLKRRRNMSLEQKSFLHDSSSHLMAPYLDKDGDEPESEVKTTDVKPVTKRSKLIQ